MSSVSRYTGLLLVVIFVAVFAVLAVSTMAIFFFCKCKKKNKKIRQIRPTVKRDEEEGDEEQGIFFQRNPKGRGLHWVTCMEIESPRVPGVSGNYAVPERVPTNDRDYHRITQRVSVDNDGNYNSRNYNKRDTVIATNATDVKKPKVQLFDGGGNSRMNADESGDFKEIQRVRYYNDTCYDNYSRTKTAVHVAENTKLNGAIEMDRNKHRDRGNDEESYTPLNLKNIDDGENKQRPTIISVDSAENYKMRKWGNVEKVDNQNAQKRINYDHKNNKPRERLANLERDGPKEVIGPIQIHGDGNNHFKLSERVKGDLTRIMEGLGENNSSSQEDTGDESQTKVNTSGGIFMKPQRIKVRDSVSREKVRDSMSRETVRDSMSREKVRDSMSRETVRDSMSRETVGDSMSRESGTTSVKSILGKRQRTTKYDNDKPREARTMSTSLGSDASTFMFTASSKTAWMFDS